jgi:hypothetical protein
VNFKTTETYDKDSYSPSSSTHYLIVGSGENTKARSGYLDGSGTSHDEALSIANCGG